MEDPGAEKIESVPPAELETSESTTDENEDDIQFVSEGPLRPVLEYIDLVSSDDEEPSTSHSDHGQDAILYLQTQVAEMSRVIRDLQSKSCFRFHHSRLSEKSSVAWDTSTSKEDNLSTVEEEAVCKSPSADDRVKTADLTQSSFTGLLRRMEQRGVIKRVTLQSETEACEGKPDYVTSRKRLVPPLHPLLKIATTEVFKDPADCHPSSFMGHRVYPVAKDTSPFQPNPPAEGPIVEALEHSKRGKTLSPLDSTSKEMEVMGCRFYHAASIAARAASYMAYMTQYQRKLWEDMEDLLHDPEFDRGKARCIISHGMDAGLWQLCTTRDIMDSVVRVMAMAVDYRRQAWLRLTSLTKKAQEKILHLPFDGTSLFGQDVNAVVAEENSVKENEYKDYDKYYNQHRYIYSHDQKAHYHNRGYSKGDSYKSRNHPYRYRKRGDSPECYGYKN